jgi:Uma2 family endonuclease
MPQKQTHKFGHLPYMPDLVAEIIPQTLNADELPQVPDKMHFYIQQGTRRVWVINPIARQVIVLTAHGSHVLTDADTLDGGDVLPGFSLALSVIFADVQRPGRR